MKDKIINVLIWVYGLIFIISGAAYFVIAFISQKAGLTASAGLIVMVMMLAMGSVFLASGIGFVRKKPWARQFLLVLAWIGVFVFVGAIIMRLIPHLPWLSADVQKDAASQVINWPREVWRSVFSIVSVLFLSWKNLIEQFNKKESL